MRSTPHAVPDLHSSTDECTGASAPRRLLDGSGSAWERRLVASAAIDRVPPGAIDRLARALEVPEPALRAAPPNGASGLSSFVKSASLAGLGALGLSVLLSVPQTREHHERPRALAAQAEAASTEVTSSDVAPHGVAAWVAPPTSRPDTALGASPPPSAAALAPRKSPANMKRTRDGLRAELRALESVQLALRAGEPAAAAQALAAYTARFPNGELAPQAQLLAADLALAQNRQGDGANGAATHMNERR